MLIGENGGDPMMAHIGMMRALHRHQPKSASAPRRKRAKAYRIVRRQPLQNSLRESKSSKNGCRKIPVRMSVMKSSAS